MFGFRAESRSPSTGFPRLSRNLRLNDPRPSGKPLAGADAAVHKLVALAMMIIAGVTIRNLHRGTEFRSIELTVVIIAGLLFLLMVVSGSLLSLGKARNDEILTLHQGRLASYSHCHILGYLPSDTWQVVRDAVGGSSIHAGCDLPAFLFLKTNVA